MNEKALRALEYNKILELLSQEASSQLGKEMVWELLPFTDRRLIEEALKETDEAVKLISFKGSLPIGSFYNINDYISLAKKGGSLSIGELLRVLYNMKTASQIKSFVSGELPDLPILISMVGALETFKELETDLDMSIENEEELSDNASPTLKSLRRQIQRQNEDIKARLNHIINKSDNKTILQDAIVTVRGDRYVIPVKQEHKAKVPGIIHDQSSSGATVFIEPQVIVNMNNQLRELVIEEQAEVARIIGELSSRVGEYYSQLRNNQEILIHLDFLMAKGKFAFKNSFEMPKVSDERILYLKGARHPLIDRVKAVPIDISLGKDFDVLVVTGPNTGGKTVSLKTVGLLSMMMQSGMHIPAASSSILPIFYDIFADIGDEQSIEQSLSTFSSHMKNIVRIIKEADDRSLILLDELGAGTDPTEGAALAISILESLKQRKSSVIATTHYTELKKYALKTPRVENASMVFDVETLSPTYKLNIGVAGKSNAFEISQKLGLDSMIIDNARNLLTSDAIAFEEVLRAVEEDKLRAEKEKDEAIELNIKMKAMEKTMEEKLKKAQKEHDDMINEAKAKAREMVREAKELTKEVQNELKELAKIQSLGERNKRLEKSKTKVKDAAGRYKEHFIVEENDNPISIDDIKIGDRVKVLTINQNGEIVGLPDSKGDITVQVGIMKMKCKAKDLKLILDGRKKKKKPTKVSYANMYKNKTMQVQTSINVQGENLDDAVMRVEKYIDDSFIAGMKEVTIIHGRGEGILMKGIQNILKTHKQVASFRYGNYNEGGQGVTIVELKS